MLCVVAILFQHTVQSESTMNEWEGQPPNQPFKKITKRRDMCKVQLDASLIYLAIIVHKIYCWAMWIVLMLMNIPHIQDL